VIGATSCGDLKKRLGQKVAHESLPSQEVGVLKNNLHGFNVIDPGTAPAIR
jgi:hypothetical protein